MEKRSFYGPDIDIPTLGQALVDVFARDGHETQIIPTQSGGVTVQARKEDTLRKIAGMSTALTVNMVMEGEYIGVEVGGAKWADKGAAGAVGVLLFFPALITAGVGAYQQTQLQSRAWQFIEQYIKTNSAFGGSAVGATAIPPFPGQPPAAGYGAVRQPQQPQPQGGYGPPRQAGPPPPVNMGQVGGPTTAAAAGDNALCAQCSQPLHPGSRFCGSCGAPAPRGCPNCNQALRPGARFCDNCGNPVAP